MQTLTERITINPEICHGKPCIRNLRYPVENILEWLSSGMTTELYFTAFSPSKNNYNNDVNSNKLLIENLKSTRLIQLTIRC